MQVFDKEWFDLHQSKLIYLLNNRFTKKLFRKLLYIDNKEFINRIEPNAYWFGAKKKGNDIEVKVDFRIDNQFSKQLYSAFKPIWYSMHTWDFIADPLIPQLSFGFSTLTTNSESGNPAASACFGQVMRDGVAESFSTIRGGAGNDHTTSPSFPAIQLNAAASGSNYSQLNRLICCFNTAALTSGATLTAAVLSLADDQANNPKQNTYSTDPTFNIVAATPASNTALADGDYTQLGATSFANIAYASWSTSNAYNDFTLDANGIANVSKTGVSRFGMNTNWDITGTGPTWGASKNMQMSIKPVGGATSPKLVVTYTTGGVAHHLLTLGVG